MRASECFAAMEQAVSLRPEQTTPVGEAVLPCPRARKARLRLVVKDDHFTIHRNCRYELEVGAERFEGTTGPDGLIDHEVPESSTTGTLRLWTDPEAQAEPELWELELGAFAPVEVESGLEARLSNLSFSAAGEEQGSALRAFQRHFGLQDSGISDGETRATLARLYSQSEEDKLEPHSWWVPEELAREGRGEG